MANATNSSAEICGRIINVKKIPKNNHFLRTVSRFKLNRKHEIPNIIKPSLPIADDQKLRPGKNNITCNSCTKRLLCTIFSLIVIYIKGIHRKPSKPNTQNVDKYDNGKISVKIYAIDLIKFVPGTNLKIEEL